MPYKDKEKYRHYHREYMKRKRNLVNDLDARVKRLEQIVLGSQKKQRRRRK